MASVCGPPGNPLARPSQFVPLVATRPRHVHIRGIFLPRVPALECDSAAKSVRQILFRRAEAASPHLAADSATPSHPRESAASAPLRAALLPTLRAKSR